MAESLWLGTYSADPTNFAAAGNWDGGVPAGGDDVIFSAEYNNPCTSGLDMGTTAFQSIIVEPGFSADIGTAALHLVSEPVKFEYHGSGVIYINLNFANQPIVITNSGTTAAGKYGVYLQGQISTLSMSGGRVSVATLSGRTASITAIRQSGGVCVVGSNTTSLGTIDLLGGSCTTRESVATVRQYSGTFETGEAAAITTKLTVYDGSAILSGSGAVASLVMDGTGSVDMLQNGVARTVTAYQNLGGTFAYDPNVITVTESSPDRAVRVSVTTV